MKGFITFVLVVCLAATGLVLYGVHLIHRDIRQNTRKLKVQEQLKLIAQNKRILREQTEIENFRVWVFGDFDSELDPTFVDNSKRIKRLQDWLDKNP